MKLARVIYICGPIQKGNLDDNIRQANLAMVELMKAGFAPINPMLSCFVGWPEVKTPEYEPRGMTHDDWLGIDLPLVQCADALLRLPGPSKGADTEVAHARRMDIPVLRSVAQVINYFAAKA